MYHINKRVYIYIYICMYMYMYKRMLDLKPENVKEDQLMYQKKCIYIYTLRSTDIVQVSRVQVILTSLHHYFYYYYYLFLFLLLLLEMGENVCAGISIDISCFRLLLVLALNPIINMLNAQSYLLKPPL